MNFVKRYKIIITVLFLLLILVATPILISIINKPKQTRSSSQGSTSIKSVSTSSTSLTTQSTSSDLPQRSVYLGMWTLGFWNEETFHLQPEKLTQLENTIGKKVAIAHYYRGWENLGNARIIAELNTIDSYGWRPMLSANPYFFSKCPANGLSLYRAIAQGNCDDFLHEASKNLKTYSKPLFFRFAWEMNIDGIGWGVLKTGSIPQDFINAWRRFHDIAVSEGATNIIWVFSPNVETPGSISYNQLYPGDAYVDWVGLDGYNWGTSKPGRSWQSFSEIFSVSYNDIVALSTNKSVMIAEVNTTNAGGDKAAWYQDMLNKQIPLRFPQIKAVVFYNEDRTKQENVNWLITVSQSSINAFSENIKNPIYVSSF